MSDLHSSAAVPAPPRTTPLWRTFVVALLGVIVGGAIAGAVWLRIVDARFRDDQARRALEGQQLHGRLTSLEDALAEIKKGGAQIVVRDVSGQRAAPASGNTAALLIHAEWRKGTRDAETGHGRRCPEGPLLDGEVAALRASLEKLGLALEVYEPDAWPRADLSRHALVIHHNGGWGLGIPADEATALSTVIERGQPLVVMGDDLGMMVNEHAVLQRALGITRVLGNGDYPVPVGAPDRTHPFVHGVVGGFQFEKEPDPVMLSPDSKVAVTAGNAPFAWSVEGRGRVAVLNLSVHSSDVCPVSSDDRQLARIFENAARWAAGTRDLPPNAFAGLLPLDRPALEQAIRLAARPQIRRCLVDGAVPDDHYRFEVRVGAPLHVVGRTGPSSMVADCVARALETVTVDGTGEAVLDVWRDI